MVRKTEPPKPKVKKDNVPQKTDDSTARLALRAAEEAKEYASQTAEIAKMAIESHQLDKLEKAIEQLLNKPESHHKPCRVVVHRNDRNLIDYLDIIPIKRKLN